MIILRVDVLLTVHILIKGKIKGCISTELGYIFVAKKVFEPNIRFQNDNYDIFSCE